MNHPLHHLAPPDPDPHHQTRALLMVCVLLAVRSWYLPLGAFTLMFTRNATLMSVLKDTYALIPPVLLAKKALASATRGGS